MARFNGYWKMPFRKGAHITLTNIADDPMTLYYQINYTKTDVPDDVAYFHAQFRRINPLPYKEVYTILDGVQGRALPANAGRYRLGGLLVSDAAGVPVPGAAGSGLFGDYIGRLTALFTRIIR